MNHLSSNPDPFDRLVDGELSERERKDLLASLDREPDGWRRCALAFLEAQCWKNELSELRQTVPAGSCPVANAKHPSGRKSATFGLPGTLLAMSACFLLALGAGVLWQHSGNRLGGISGVAGPEMIAGKIGEPSATTPTRPDAQADNGSTPWQWVRLSPVGSTDPEQTVQVPAIQRDRIDERWLQSLPSPIPDSVVQALLRNGYKIQTQQELMPMPLKDGRRLVVPIDQVDIHYVGNQTY